MGSKMMDSKGNEYEVCPGEARNAPARLRHEAHRLRQRADLLEKLADQTDGKLCEVADTVLFSLIHDFSENNH